MKCPTTLAVLSLVGCVAGVLGGEIGDFFGALKKKVLSQLPIPCSKYPACGECSTNPDCHFCSAAVPLPSSEHGRGVVEGGRCQSRSEPCAYGEIASTSLQCRADIATCKMCVAAGQGWVETREGSLRIKGCVPKDKCLPADSTKNVSSSTASISSSPSSSSFKHSNDGNETDPEDELPLDDEVSPSSSSSSSSSRRLLSGGEITHSLKDEFFKCRFDCPASGGYSSLHQTALAASFAAVSTAAATAVFL